MWLDTKLFQTKRSLTKKGIFFISIKSLFVSVLLLVISNANAQILQANRVEIPIQNGDEGYTVISASNTGTVLIRQLQFPSGDQIEIIHTDTSFQQKWSGFIPIQQNLVLSDYLTYQGFLYLLFYHQNLQQRNFTLLKIDLANSAYSNFTINNIIPFVPSALKATAYGVLISGYYVRVPVVLFFNKQTQSAKILPGLFNQAGELTQISVNPDESFEVIISAKNYQKQNTLWIKSYSPQGDLIRNTALEPDYPNQFLFGNSLYTADNKQIIAGVFGNRKGEYSKGIFITQIERTGEQHTNYYNFADMENFFKFMKASREQRMKEKIERKKIKGKKIRLQYRFMVHEFIPYKNNFLLLGEAFYPQYKTVEPRYGNALVPGADSRIFDGYRYTHAVVLGIDPTGKLLWDNSFEINDIKSYSLEQFVKMDTQRDDIALLYLFDEKIRSKIIQGNKVIEGKTLSELKGVARPEEAEANSNINKLDYWYGKYFLAYGIDHKQLKIQGKKKKVFFMTKVYYR